MNVDRWSELLRKLDDTARKAARAGDYDLSSQCSTLASALEDDSDTRDGKCDRCGAVDEVVRVRFSIGHGESESADWCVSFEDCNKRAAARRHPVISGVLDAVARMENR